MKNKLYSLFLCIAAVLFFSACKDDIKVNKSSPFSVELMPYRNNIEYNNPVELRFSLIPKLKTDEVSYTVRFFQYTGEGTLSLNGTILKPNDRYTVPTGDFRMYFNAPPASGASYDIELVFEDNFGRKNEVKLKFSINSRVSSGTLDDMAIFDPSNPSDYFNKVINKDGIDAFIPSFSDDGSGSYDNGDSTDNGINGSSGTEDAISNIVSQDGSTSYDDFLTTNDEFKKLLQDKKMKVYNPLTSKDTLRGTWQVMQVLPVAMPSFIGKKGGYARIYTFLLLHQYSEMNQNGLSLGKKDSIVLYDASHEDIIEFIPYVSNNLFDHAFYDRQSSIWNKMNSYPIEVLRGNDLISKLRFKKKANNYMLDNYQPMMEISASNSKRIMFFSFIYRMKRELSKVTLDDWRSSSRFLFWKSNKTVNITKPVFVRSVKVVQTK